MMPEIRTRAASSVLAARQIRGCRRNGMFSIHLKVALLDDLSPGFRILGKKRRELCRGAAHRDLAEVQHLLSIFLAGGDALHYAGEAFQHFGWGAGWRKMSAR